MTKTQDQAAKEADAALKNSRKWRTLRDKEDSPDYGGGTGSAEYFLYGAIEDAYRNLNQLLLAAERGEALEWRRSNGPPKF